MRSRKNHRIGLLVPSSNTTMEQDFCKMTPEGFSIHSSRMRLKEVTAETLFVMAEDAKKGSDLLASADVDVILYGCTSGSLVGGVEWEENLIHQIQQRTGISVISTSHAVIQALKYLNGKVIGVATPYIDEVNDLEKRFLESYGFKVPYIKGLGIINNLEIGRTREEVIIDLVMKVAADVDIIFISCTNLPVIHLIEKLECELGKPVITSNQSSLWAILRMYKFKGMKGFGQLFKCK